jgi:UDP-2,3-diacylglucosamine pyrophosphatase LpxH
MPDARAAPFTVVLSDLHLSDVEAPDPRWPLWRRHKHPDLLQDGRLVRFLDHVRTLAPGRIELVLNGDVFDFDSIKAVPERPPFPVGWLERQRGLAPEQPKSAWKMRRILADHVELVGALGDFVAAGNELVLVIGNHDLELHWPAVQAEIRSALRLPPSDHARVRFCEWFTISGGDTLVTHGNQLDPYCVCQDPLHPLIEGACSTRTSTTASSSPSRTTSRSS